MRISKRQIIRKYRLWEENLSVQFFEQMWKPGVTQSSFVLQDPWKQKWEIQILITKVSRNIEYLNRHRSFNGCHRYLTMGAQVSWSASPSKWIVLWILRENIFRHFINEPWNKGLTDHTAKGHITILHSQSRSREAQTAECFHWDWHRPGFNGGEKTSTFQCVYGHVFQWLFWSLRVTYPSHSYALGWSASMWSQRFSRTPKRRPPFSSSLGAGHL